MMLIEHESLTTKQIVALYFIHDGILEFTWVPNRNRVSQEAQAQ